MMLDPGAKKSHPFVHNLTVMLVSSPKKIYCRKGSYGTSLMMFEDEKLNPDTQNDAGRGFV